MGLKDLRVRSMTISMGCLTNAASFTRSRILPITCSTGSWRWMARRVMTKPSAKRKRPVKRDCSGDSGVDIDRAGSRFYTTGPNLLSQGDPTMFGPGEYVPDPTEGIVDVKDLPTPQLVA